MPCEGVLTFQQVDGTYYAVLNGWLLAVQCVAGGPTGWRLTVISINGATSVYFATAISTCNPILISFTNVLIDCGVVTLTLAPCPTPSASSASASACGTLRESLGFAEGVGSSLTLPTISVDSGTLLVVVAAVVGTTNVPSVAFGATLPTGSVVKALSGSVNGRVGVYWWSGLSSAEDITVSAGAASSVYFTLQAVQVNGLQQNVVDSPMSDSDNGNNTAPWTGHQNVVGAQGCEYSQAAFLMVNPGGAHAWVNGFTSGGQDLAQSVGANAYSVTEGYLLWEGTPGRTIPALSTLAEQWAGVVVTFK